ncbi:histone-lysine N-methyltransferase SETMAR [Plakobranchus ocellatus]|uniref:Histone-lysine N-methyltransferase SETMAR n=1 Tax=Plakobranchus ocellatus TaxID=259542 RepID=A0AAV3ZZQ5_9GAST|nr:histone-lysine N-methyltransferase SETMAR [Plakobranchus ocellatus]
MENYGEHAMLMTQVYQWCSWFKDNRTNLQDEPRSGLVNTANNDWNTARVDELIKVNRRVKLKEISLKLDIPKTNVYEIVHDKLGYHKVSARWVPKCCQMSISARDSKSPKSCCTGVNKKVMKPLMWGLAGTIVPGTSSLNTSSLEMKLGYTRALRRQNATQMTWKHPSSPVTKKFKVQQSATKVVATVFWDSCGMILLDILPKGESVNADRYCETLDRLRHAVRRKRSGLLRSKVVLQHDNPTPHTAKRTKEWLEHYRWDIIPHPAHIPDLVPSNFHLFGS